MKIFNMILLIFISILMVSCSKPPDETNYISIGAVFPLTGEDSDEGLRAYNGIRLATDEINANGGILGKSLDFTILNDQGDEAVIVEQYKKLKENNVSAIIGSSYSGVSIAMAKEAFADNMPMISTTASSPELTVGRPNVFRTVYIDDYQAQVMAKFALTTLNAKTAAVLYNNDVSASLYLAEIFKTSFEASGGTVVFIGGYDSSDTKFETIVNQFINNEPDVIFCTENNNNIAKLLTYAYYNDIRKTSFLGTDMWDGLTAYITTHEPLNNAYFCKSFLSDDTDERTQEFVKKYREAFNEPPLAGSAIAYDTVYVLAEAIKNAGSTDREKIIEELKATDLSAVTGRITYDQNNNPTKDAYIVGFQRGQYTTFEKILP